MNGNGPRTARASTRARGGHPTAVKQRSALGLGTLAIVACCGVKVLVLAGLALSVGSFGVVVRNVALGVAGLAVAAALVAYAARRRRGHHECVITPARGPTASRGEGSTRSPRSEARP